VLTAIGVLLALQNPSSDVELTLELEAAVELTSRPDVTGLVSQYSYLGEPITTLFSVRATLKNTGDTTLVGAGGRSSLIGDKLQLLISDRHSILKVETRINQPEATVTDSAESVVVTFGQWKIQEELVLTLFVSDRDETVDNLMPSDLSLFLPSRQIIDGDVVIFTVDDGSIGPVDVSSRYLDRYGIYGLGYRWLSGIIASLIIGVSGAGIGGLIIAVISGFRYSRWARNYGSAYQNFIESIDPDDPELVDHYDPVESGTSEIGSVSEYSSRSPGQSTFETMLEPQEWDEQAYLENPTFLPDFLWGRFSGPEAPTDKPSNILVYFAGILLVTVGFILGFTALFDVLPADINLSLF
jgi:hypothetical protein